MLAHILAHFVAKTSNGSLLWRTL